MVANPSSRRSHLSLAPHLFVGIDIGKLSHTAGFVSASLLQQKRFEQCPTLVFEQSQAGVAKLLARIREYAPLHECAVLVESTGHYHRALCEQLIAHRVSVYIIPIYTRRTHGQSKTDRADALRLANSLYAQLALGLQIADRSQQVRQLAPATDAAMQLQGFVRRRYELVQSITRTKNKLTAICDELFPEFATIFKDPNAPIALDLRHRWPTPLLLTGATLEELRQVRRGHGPADQKLLSLQQAAAKSIGVSLLARTEALVFEQEQLIEALLVQQEQIEALEQRITAIVEASREGQILLSIDCMGPVMAAILLATIGNIRNFRSKGALRKYCGWAPQDLQTGISLDRSVMNPTGSRLVKQTLFLLAISSVHAEETVWHQLYERLVPLKCAYDAKKQVYRGKMRVIGRICGQMVGVIYHLLKDDANLVDNTPDQEPLPAPQLYDRAIHSGSKQKPSSSHQGRKHENYR